MTAIRKSDSQLDAEAAANSAVRAVSSEQTRYSPMGAAPPALFCGGHARAVRVYDRHGSPHLTACCFIHEARREWWYAHPEDLHVFRVPSDVEMIPVDLTNPEGPQEAVLDSGAGPPFAPVFAAYLQDPHEGIVRGLREQRRICASQHATWADHRGAVVCGLLLWSVIANGNTIAEAADTIEITPELATDLLHTALRTMWTWRSRAANGLTKVV